MTYLERKNYYRATPKPREAKTICHCGKVAWYLAGKKGFCGDHRKDAEAAAKQAAQRIY
jgi:hypothetical protein